jgi:hypothetical protein
LHGSAVPILSATQYRIEKYSLAGLREIEKPVAERSSPTRQVRRFCIYWAHQHSGKWWRVEDMHNPFHVKRAAFLMTGVVLAAAMTLASCGSPKPKLSTEDAVTEGFVELRMQAY